MKNRKKCFIFQAVQKFEFMHDFFRATVDLVDLVGIYLVMQRVSG